MYKSEYDLSTYSTYMYMIGLNPPSLLAANYCITGNKLASVCVVLAHMGHMHSGFLSVTRVYNNRVERKEILHSEYFFPDQQLCHVHASTSRTQKPVYMFHYLSIC